MDKPVSGINYNHGLVQKRQAYWIARYANPQLVPLDMEMVLYLEPGQNFWDLFYESAENLIKIKKHFAKNTYREGSHYIIEWWEGDSPELENLIYHNKIPQWITVSHTVFPNHKKIIDPYYVQLHPGSYCNYYRDYKQQYETNVVTNQGFNCFLNRLDVIRQSWLYQLIRRNLFDHGYVSFNMNTHYVEEKYKDFSAQQIFQAQFEQYHSHVFAQEHKIAQTLVPYRNFDPLANLDHVIMQSKFSMVVETYFNDNNVIQFTEKIVRVLRLPRPWVLLGPKNAVKYLRAWGFDVLDDLVDHSRYDKLESRIEREIAILDISKTLLEFDTEKHWLRLKAASDHNLKLLDNWASRRFEFCLMAWHEAFVKAHKLGYMYPPPGLPTIIERIWSD
jgi:hypothetical protein